MIDIHSHILPNVDDGAKSLAESIALLKQLKAQGCTHVIATPHFYPEETNLEHFLSKATAKYELLCQAVEGKNLPVILRGSEIHFFPYIDRCEELSQLTLGGSKYILIELPHSRVISEDTIDSIIAIKLNRGYIPVLAHLERYYHQKNFAALCNIVNEGYAKAQVDASSVTSHFKVKRTALALIKSGIASYIASDAHNSKTRPVLFDRAFEIIEERLGRKYKENLLQNSDKLLEEIGMK